MPKTPSSEPPPPLSPVCDPRLPAAALAYRTARNLLSQTDLGAINVTAWLYRDPQGVQGLQVNPNVTIAQLKQQFGVTEPKRRDANSSGTCICNSLLELRVSTRGSDIAPVRGCCCEGMFAPCALPIAQKRQETCDDS